MSLLGTTGDTEYIRSLVLPGRQATRRQPETINRQQRRENSVPVAKLGPTLVYITTSGNIRIVFSQYEYYVLLIFPYISAPIETPTYFVNETREAEATPQFSPKGKSYRPLSRNVGTSRPLPTHGDAACYCCTRANCLWQEPMAPVCMHQCSMPSSRLTPSTLRPKETEKTGPLMTPLPRGAGQLSRRRPPIPMPHESS